MDENKITVTIMPTFESTRAAVHALKAVEQFGAFQRSLRAGAEA